MRTASYDFPTIFQRVNQLATVDLSRSTPTSRRIGSTRSRPSSPERRSAQTAMYVIADGLVRLLAPILPMTADELWRHLPGQRDASVHVAEFPAADEVESLLDADLADRWERLKSDARRRQRGARGEASGQDHRHLARRARQR